MPIQNLKLWMVVLVACVALAALGWQKKQAEDELAAALLAKAEQENTISELEKSLAAANEREVQLKVEVEKLADRGAPGYYPPDAQNGIESLYGVDAATGNSAEIDKLKKRYEELLVNNMFLRKCGKTQPYDMHVIIAALSQDMASINAPGRLQYDVLNSARGSFKEIYENSPCESRDVDPIATQYRQYIDTVAQQLN